MRQRWAGSASFFAGGSNLSSSINAGSSGKTIVPHARTNQFNAHVRPPSLNETEYSWNFTGKNSP